MRKFSFFLFVLFQINIFSGSSPKNIIILIGDGMGVNYVSASVLSIVNDPFRRFSMAGLSVTCSADNLITDSAAGATAIATGYRTNNHSVSVHPETGEPLFTILEFAERLNKSSGIVVTSSVTHATPGAFVAHVQDRSMELDIAKQLTEMDLEVVIGGGKKYLMPKTLGGDRTDEINLIADVIDKGYKYYDSYDKLKNEKPVNKFYALLEPGGLLKASERDYSLGDLVKTAIEYLSEDENGFVLLIEGSQIDWAGHQRNQDYLLSEMRDFNTAINTALDFAEQEGETLVLVTADHETGGMSITDGKPDGCNVHLEFLNKDHTAVMVGYFIKGPGSEEFTGVMDNYMIGRKLFKLLDNSYHF